MTLDTHKLARLGLFTALASILGYIESLLPVFPGIPGIKPGLANLAVLFLLRRYTWKEAAVVSAARILIIGFLFGNLFGIIYSFSGAVLSLCAMTFFQKKTDVSPVMLSILGGVFHNAGQLAAAMVIVENSALIYYAPALLVAGVVTGAVVGIITSEVSRRI